MRRYTELILLCLALVSFSATTHSQTPTASPSATPPVSDIFIVDLKSDRGDFRVGPPAKITQFAGYNNQPSFMPDGHGILYTAIRDKQADIYLYDTVTAKTTQITNTPESEYSPTLMPDQKFISVVRVEADGTQRLWKFPLNGGQPALVLEKIKPVGYHCWIDDHTLALFILGARGAPNTLQVVEVTTQQAEIIADDPGRVLRLIPREQKLSFVQKSSPQDWFIRSFDLRSRTVATLIKTLAGVEDYAWTTSEVLLMAKDAKLFKWDQRKDQDWREAADFSQAGLNRITRLAVSPQGDKLAMVVLR